MNMKGNQLKCIQLAAGTTYAATRGMTPSQILTQNQEMPIKQGGSKACRRAVLVLRIANTQPRDALNAPASSLTYQKLFECKHVMHRSGRMQN